MRHAMRTIVAGTLALLGAAGAAAAATITWPDGKSERFAMGREITGPAVVTSDSEDCTIGLREGAVLRFVGETRDGERMIESFFLKRGAVDADADYRTRIATPAFWVFPKVRNDRLRAVVTTLDTRTGHARVARDSGPARLFIEQVGDLTYEVQALPGQGVALTRGTDGSLRFRTDADNEWTSGRIRIVRPVGDGKFLDVLVAKATEGTIEPLPASTPRFRVTSEPWSWASAATRIQLRTAVDLLAKAEAAPGTAIESDGGTLAAAKPAGAPAPPRVDAGPAPSGTPATAAREDSNLGQRRGTALLGGLLEVCEVRADLASAKPSLSFVVERAPDAPGPLPETVRWSVELHVGGLPIHLGEQARAARPLPGSLDAPGARVTLTVEGLEAVPGLAGAWPVLRVTP